MRNPFYFPDRNKYDSPERLGMAYEDVFFKSQDGTVLNGWFIPALTEAAGTVIHMHGNAQNISAHWAFAQWLPEQGYNLFVFDYRGFGQSQGEPDEKGVFEDSVAALDYIRSREGVDSENLYVFGQSLGGMLSICAAAASPEGIRAVLAEAPIHSYGEWAFDMMPELELATYDEFCACNFVDQLAPIPLLLLHSQTDKVVPYSHSELLYKLAKEPKQLETIPAGDHNSAMTNAHGDQYRRLMLDFFSSPGV